METGSSYEFTYTVNKNDLATEVGVSDKDVFPAVLATSRVLGLMEVSAARLMKPLLREGELSVGVGIDMKHFAPTPVDEEIRCIATFEGMDNKIYIFKVEVFDRAGKVAGGTHTRAVVNGAKITGIALQRMLDASA